MIIFLNPQMCSHLSSRCQAFTIATNFPLLHIVQCWIREESSIVLSGIWTSIVASMLNGLVR